MGSERNTIGWLGDLLNRNMVLLETYQDQILGGRKTSNGYFLLTGFKNLTTLFASKSYQRILSLLTRIFWSFLIKMISEYHFIKLFIFLKT